MGLRPRDDARALARGAYVVAVVRWATLRTLFGGGLRCPTTGGTRTASSGITDRRLRVRRPQVLDRVKALGYAGVEATGASPVATRMTLTR
jgi:hypothetical protein